MESVIRAVVVYVALMIMFNVAGKRSMSETNTFDFVVLLIISEAVQNALIGEDLSLTNALLIVMTLLGLMVGMSVWRYRSSKLEKLLSGGPLILVRDGNLMEDRMRMARVDLPDILLAARSSQGLERLEQIKYAVLEEGGSISIIAKQTEES
ncbi:DUF421 domain-containing protein [Deinococcus peraridilitoris]|uniref:Putative membrane protein n=1 Tax=Deinococcus peraridilitoris (strain DSM 19664 / LMG 22246 / CIP 109416 / KR-200) TaxID=937777 RepID=L0A004_DEIPD|nr:YetF domain-containing protein [Deinococcus peraridilitoris]AFZ66779.1 putative membrane protein [Deinococcus peraridilitoris DSM 19664]